MKKNEENCSFPFLGFFLHHWKQKWWKNMKKWLKHDKQMKKRDKHMIKKMIKNDTWNVKKHEDDKINDKNNDECNDNQNDKKKWKKNYFDLAQSVAASFS